MANHGAAGSAVAAVTCREIIEAFRRAHPFHLFSDDILNRFLGLRVSASGTITNQDRVGFGLAIITEVVDDHGITVLCNFRKPVPREVAELRKGTSIKVSGVVSNANNEAVVLSDCHLDG